MNRTLCILVWTVITYYTSLNMVAFNFGDYTQVIGLVFGTSLSAFVITAFVATEKEVLKLGFVASVAALAIGAKCDPNSYFHFFYNPESFILIHKALLFIALGTAGCVRTIYLYNKAVRQSRYHDSLYNVLEKFFCGEA